MFDESTERHEFWLTATDAQNIALLKKIAKLRRKGIDIEPVVNSLLGE
jgi:hypothetical protein